MNNKPATLFKWGKQRRDWIYIKDVVDANMLALNYTGSNILIRWEKPMTANIKSIKIYRTDESNSSKIVGTVPSNQTSFEDKTITTAKEYSYTISFIE